MTNRRGWIGFDLDGCLAEYHGWVGFSKIGDPVDRMVKMLSSFAYAGWEVRVFTGRVAPDPDTTDISVEERRKLIRDWLNINVVPHLPEGYPEIKITHEKDKFLYCFYDDRCRAVVPSMGLVYMDLLRDLSKRVERVLSSAYETPQGTIIVPKPEYLNNLIQVQRVVADLVFDATIKDLPESK